MKISKSKLNQIILEEYMKEEGLDEALSPERAAEVIAWIRGKGPRPDWLGDDYGKSGRSKSGQSPVDSSVDRAADTMPLPTDGMPQYDDDEIDDGGAYEPDAEAPEVPMDTGAIEDQIAALVQGMPPEEVSDLFQAVFAKIPGVEIGPPEEEEPDTLYTPGAEGRPQISLGPLREAVFQKLMEAGGTMYRGMGSAYKRDEDEIEEGEYHDMGGEEEMYDALDPLGFANMSDAELVNQAWKDGIEKTIVLDGEGDLVNREELLAAMKDV